DGEGLVHGLDPGAAGVHRVAEADLLALQLHGALIGDEPPGQRLDQAGLARAVVADHREDLARVELQVTAGDGGDRSVPLDQALRLQDGRASGAARRAGRLLLRCGHTFTFRIHWSIAT